MIKKLIITGASSPIAKEVVSLLPKDIEILKLSSSICYKGIPFNLNNVSSDILKIIHDFKADSMIHLAWTSVTSDTYNYDSHFFNLIGSLNLIKEFILSGGRNLLSVGSFAEYGDFKGTDKKISENELCFPNNYYAKCRNELCSLLDIICEHYCVNYTWARIFSAFGMETNSSRLTSQIISSIKNNSLLEIKTSKVIRDFIYMKDIAKALVNLLFLEKNNGIVNISNSKPMTIGEFASIFMRYSGKMDLLKCLDFDLGQAKYIVGDNSKLVHLIDYSSSYSVDEAAIEILKYNNIKVNVSK